MKKVFGIFLALALVAALSACGGAATEAGRGGELSGGGSTVAQLLEDAVSAETPADGERPQGSLPASATERPTGAPDAQIGEIDIDLTQLSGTMIYSGVYSMLTEPEAFVGKTVRLAGYCASSYYEPSDTTYYAVIIPDAAACCAQGIEYLLAEGAAYPADGAEIVITGIFEVYEEAGVQYCRLGSAEIES